MWNISKVGSGRRNCQLNLLKWRKRKRRRRNTSGKS